MTKLLIVDDMADNRLMVKLALEKEDAYHFLEAENGQEGLDIARHKRPDIILMDAMMPVMDGFAATRAIRKIEVLQRTPILMLTALNSSEDKIKALECGVNDFISKPFDPTELRARCHSYALMAKIDKRYTLSTKNPNTRLPNKIKLIEDLPTIRHPLLILMRLKDFHILSNLYPTHIVQQFVRLFVDKFFSLIPPKLQSASFYNLYEDQFALLVDYKKVKIAKIQMYHHCQSLFDNIKKDIIRFDGYIFDQQLETVAFSSDPKSAMRHVALGLSYGIEKKMPVVDADKVIGEIDRSIKHNLQTIAIIKSALAHHRVHSYFQPIYNNHTHQIEKYESLIRIEDEKGQILTPYHFLDIAKKSDYYLPLSRRVIENSFHAAKHHLVEISINISPLEIDDTFTKELILHTLHTNHDMAHRIVFELLEDESINHFDAIEQFIGEIKKLGAKIAIDDFGSGYSNFERLLLLMPDYLKIDGSLVKNIVDNASSLAIVETICLFAKKTGIKTIAEFVSDQAIFSKVQALGIDYTQGYFIAPPLPTIGEKA